MEIALLIWFVVGAGIAALVATSIIAGVAILAMLQGLVNASGLN